MTLLLVMLYLLRLVIRFYSGVVAGAREALMSGVPSMSISLNWKKDESQDTDFKDLWIVCLPLIKAAIRDIEKGIFPRSCLLNIEVPTSPLTNKVFSSDPAYNTGDPQLLYKSTY
ncbi:hypothetical protein LOK49_Contig34G00010 [Camellia lanceoleosa]|nr:hypothetical protein LOK49_Contig34G00010 [Camellia lanceoleosa]